MPSDRREFVRQAATLAAALPAYPTPAVAAQQRAAAMPTPRARALMETFGSAASARQALYLGADFLICQGTEAGGHVQATTPRRTPRIPVVCVLI